MKVNGCLRVPTSSGSVIKRVLTCTECVQGRVTQGTGGQPLAFTTQLSSASLLGPAPLQPEPPYPIQAVIYQERGYGPSMHFFGEVKGCFFQLPFHFGWAHHGSVEGVGCKGRRSCKMEK